jgi:uncharacterized protein YpmS
MDIFTNPITEGDLVQEFSEKENQESTETREINDLIDAYVEFAAQKYGKYGFKFTLDTVLSHLSVELRFNFPEAHKYILNKLDQDMKRGK